MSDAEAVARAERNVGYGMIKKVATLNGIKDWLD